MKHAGTWLLLSVYSASAIGCSLLDTKRNRENTAALSTVLSESEVVWFGECDGDTIVWTDARGRKVVLPVDDATRATVCGRVSIAKGSYARMYAEAERWRASQVQ